MKIDAHHHFWNYNPSEFEWIDDTMDILKRDYEPKQFNNVLVENNIDGSMLVQVNQNEAENDFFHEYALKNDFIKGTIGWVDLKSKELNTALEKYQTYKKLKGFRHIVQSEPNDFLLDPSFIEGVKSLYLKNYTYDILVYHTQLKSVLNFVRQLPNNRLIIDHIAKPDIANQKISQWANYLKEIAKHPNVFVKVSGMVTEANWKTWKKEDFYIYLDYILDYFGTDRIVYGSDWPVCLLSATYQQQLEIVQTYFGKLSKNEQDKIFGLNAIEFYQI